MGERRLLERGGDVALSGLAAVLERLGTTRPSLAVLTYHRVAPVDERPDLHPGLCVDPAAFDAHMGLLASRANPVSMEEILATAAGHHDLPRRAVHVTFDDAYRDFEDHAWPVLRRHGITATMFVPTSYPDRPNTFWWDRLSNAVRRASGPVLRVGSTTWSLAEDRDRTETFVALRAQVASLPHDRAMALVAEVVDAAEAQGAPPIASATASWDALRAMAAEGLALGAHSRRHPFLDRIPVTELEEEIGGSLEDLRRAVGDHALPVFAYPSGAHDDGVVAATARAGIELGFTTERGVADLADPDWLRLPRINVGRRTRSPLVRIQLTPAPHAARRFGHVVGAQARKFSQPTNPRPPWN